MSADFLHLAPMYRGIGFKWSALPEGSIVLDIGGGVGSTALPIIHANSHLRLIVQDTEDVLKNGPGVSSFWNQLYLSPVQRIYVSPPLN
jgi:hypothetical protein